MSTAGTKKNPGPALFAPSGFPRGLYTLTVRSHDDPGCPLLDLDDGHRAVRGYRWRCGKWIAGGIGPRAGFRPDRSQDLGCDADYPAGAGRGPGSRIRP